LASPKPRRPRLEAPARREGEERQNQLLLSLAAFMFAAIVSLAIFGETRLPVYAAVLAIIYFAVTLVFRVKSRTRFDFVSVIVLAVFVASILASTI
jgi:hypothetical protein